MYPNDLNPISLHPDAVAPTVTTISLTAKSVVFSFMESEFSLPIIHRSITLTRVTGSGQALCPSFRHQRKLVETASRTASITGLEEFSVYAVATNITFERTGTREEGTTMLSATSEITTLSAGMK